MSSPLFHVERLSLRFGGLHALKSISFAVAPQEIVGIVGPNGAGKSSLFNTISGLYAPTAGRLYLSGRRLRKRFGARQALFICGCALFSAVASLILSANADRLFFVAVKQSYREGSASPASILARAQNYLHDQPHVESQLQGVRVVSADGRTQLGTFATLAEGRQFAQAASRSVPMQRAAERAQGRLRLAAFIGLICGGYLAYSLIQQGRVSPVFIARSGISRTFQNNRLFLNMTVFENLRVASERARKSSFWWLFGLLASTSVFILATSTGALNWPVSAGGVVIFSMLCLISRRRAKRWRTSELETMGDADLQRLAQIEMILDEVGLKARTQIKASSLSYGERRLLEIGRAWATAPTLLLLDEPAAGMNANETENLGRLLRKIQQTGITILLVEHDMPLVMRLCNRVIVLDRGEKIADGTPGEVQTDPRVIDAYLGRGSGKGDSKSA